MPEVHTEADAERVVMALAEAGYPDEIVIIQNGRLVAVFPVAPGFVQWKAHAIAGAAINCWPCRRALGPDVPGPDTGCGHLIVPFCSEDAEPIDA